MVLTEDRVKELFKENFKQLIENNKEFIFDTFRDFLSEIVTENPIENQEKKKTDDYYQRQIAEDILNIASSDENRESFKNFTDRLEAIEARSCKVKYGWHSGDNISFTLAFEKGFGINAFDLFVANIASPAEVFGFINGLSPEIFQYDSKYTIEDESHVYMKLKLKRHG